jgi:hypothetical protein
VQALSIFWRRREMEEKKDPWEKARELERMEIQENHNKIAKAMSDLLSLGYKVKKIAYEHGTLEILCYPPEKGATDARP